MIKGALYYPYIHFRDDAWLKLAALYWDRIGRIVPDRYVTNDSRTVRELSDGLDLVWNLHPESFAEALDAVASRFLRLLDQNRDSLRSHYGLEHAEGWPELPNLEPGERGFALQLRSLRHTPDAKGRLGYLWHTKISVQLLDALEELNLTPPRSDGASEWVGMHPRLLAVYMTALAEELSRATGLAPVADGDLEHLAVLDGSVDTIADLLLGDMNLAHTRSNRREDSNHFVLLAVQAVAPRNLDSVPVSKIVELRNQHVNEFMAFQDQIGEFVRNLLELETRNPAVLQEHLNWFAKHRLRPQMRELEKAMRSSAIEPGTVILSSAIAAGTGAMLGPFPVLPVLGTAGMVALGAVNWSVQRRTRNQDLRRQDPVASFLLRLAQDLEPRSLISRLNDLASHHPRPTPAGLRPI